MYVLGSEAWWPLSDSLNYYSISQLKLFCQQFGKWDKIPYVEAFMLLHKEDSKK